MEFETIDATDMSQSRKQDLANRMISGDGGINDIIALKQDALLGEFDHEPRTITTEHYGDSPEAALARVYKTRDSIERHTDASVECELTGKAWEFPSTTFYEVAIHINGGDR